MGRETDRRDPNTWTERYASSNRAECLEELRGINSLVVTYLRQKNYKAAAVGLDGILNGLIALQNGKCGDFRSHIAMSSLCEASIIAFGALGADISESRRRETALSLFEDARDFSKSKATKEILCNMIAELKSGVSPAKIQQKYDPDFPQSEIEMLTDLHSRLSTVS